MRLLILGGTVFLGRALVDAAVERGHEVTLFNRGVHSPELYPDIEKLRGDRDGDRSALEGRTWDAVIDPSGYVPRIVAASATLLAQATGHYTFISSISVYPEFPLAGMDESAPTATLDDPTTEEVGPNYGGLKAACERAAAAAMPGRVLSVRAGMIVGPHDPTNRFTYWPVRIARGGDVLAPGRPERAVQLIDVRDLAAWCVAMAEARTPGVFNATGPHAPLSMGEMLDACLSVSGSDARLRWASDGFLVEHGVGAWSEMPFWLPESRPEMAGFMQVDCGKAFASGLTTRPLEETIRDTLAWHATLGAPVIRGTGLPLPTAGMDPARETELLRLLSERTGA